MRRQPILGDLGPVREARGHHPPADRALQRAEGKDQPQPLLQLGAERAAKRAERAKVAQADTKKTPKAKASPKPLDPYAESTPKQDPAAAYKTGFQQYVRGDTAGALATFKSSLAANPGYPSTYRGLGLVYEKMGNKSQAKRAFSRYPQLSPKASDADQIRERMGKL